ncbi:MAG: DHA2 family efflux MFS transporter permease subunit [Pseudonocardiales bacterium]
MLEKTQQVASARLVLLLACGAAFLSLLDATVVNLAIADLHLDFQGASLTGLSWVITAYAVLLAAMLSAAGRLADTRGARPLFIGGITLFTLFSLLCGLAPNPTTLIAARALQGVGAAAMIPASLALLLTNLPTSERAKAIGLWSGAGGLAAAVGPTLGGVLVDAWGWRALFLINIPVGLAILIGARRLARTQVGERRHFPDVLGSVLLAGGVGAIVLGATEGQTWGWSDARTLLSIAGGVVAVARAVVRSRHHAAPAIEISLWRNRSFAATNLASLLYGASLYSLLLIGVLVLTQVWDYSVLRAGLAMTPGAFTSMVGAVVGGRMIEKRGPRPVLIIGALLMVAACVSTIVWLSTTPNYLGLWLPVGLIIGLGMGAVAVATNSAAALNAPPVRFAGAIGLNTTARQVGGALGIAALAIIQTERAGQGLSPFTWVYVWGTATAVGAALAALGIAKSTTSAVVPVARATVERAAR